MIAANIHEGFGKIIDFCELAKNAPKGFSNPQAGRSSRPGCATIPEILLLRALFPLQDFADFCGQVVDREGFLQKIHALVQHASVGNNVRRIAGHIQASEPRIQ
jgi:hypothetical protein